jgi:hypothetical protein
MMKMDYKIAVVRGDRFCKHNLSEAFPPSNRAMRKEYALGLAFIRDFNVEYQFPFRIRIPFIVDLRENLVSEIEIRAFHPRLTVHDSKPHKLRRPGWFIAWLVQLGDRIGLPNCRLLIRSESHQTSDQQDW